MILISKVESEFLTNTNLSIRKYKDEAKCRAEVMIEYRHD